jgi:hypothetical protein
MAAKARSSGVDREGTEGSEGDAMEKMKAR